MTTKLKIINLDSGPYPTSVQRGQQSPVFLSAGETLELNIWEPGGSLTIREGAAVPDVERIAALCHTVNRIYCQSIGDHSQTTWEEAPDWQKASALNGVRHALETNASPRESHESWLKEKEATGWKYWPTKDIEKKEHPCFVPYDELPESQKYKDALFVAICRAGLV